MLMKTGKRTGFFGILGAAISAILSSCEANPLDADISAILQTGDQSIKKCDLQDVCDDTEKFASGDDSYYRKSKYDWDSLGIDPKNLNVNQIAVGFVPAFKDTRWQNSPQMINEKLIRPMAIVGDYISISGWDPDFRNIDWHFDSIKTLDGNPVWCIALMPVEGLDSVTDAVMKKIALKFKKINDAGVTVWCRFAYEMNGNWNAWGHQPEKFKSTWERLAWKIKAVTNRTYMLWAPNIRFGDSVDDIRGGYTPYFPDPETVHIAGISFYHYGRGEKRLNIVPTAVEAVSKLYEFAKIYGKGGWNKPVVIAETAAAYVYYQGTHKPVPGGASEVDIKLTWLHLILDQYIKVAVPDLKALIWFEIAKDENATGNTAFRTIDFRLIVGSPEVSRKANALFSQYARKERRIMQ